MPEFLKTYLQAFAGQISKKIIAMAVMIFLILLSVIMIYIGINALVVLFFQFAGLNVYSIVGIFLLLHIILISIFTWGIKRAMSSWSMKIKPEEQDQVEKNTEYDADQLITDSTEIFYQITQNLDSPDLIIKNIMKMKNIFFAYIQATIVKIIKRFYEKRKVSSN